ncbi:MAG: hypothetical protein HKM98_01585 [Gammaproteobacteria bacterium]|nr:hypothetical protein [Gammaproteobacteria bacterium]
MSSANAHTPNKPSILAQARRDDANRYIARHAYTDLPELPSVDPRLGLVLVIPAMAEPDILEPLQSLADCAAPDCMVEIIVVINLPDDATEEKRDLTSSSLDDARRWAAGAGVNGLRCHVLDYSELPARHASVGLARKLGMDVALMRLAASASGSGVIASLDADCQVDSDYLQAIEQAYQSDREMVGATVYFEHPVEKTEAALRPAIIDYETHLRCYKQGVEAAGSAYARHTVGSALTVRSKIYAQEGGMNRRTAGEDFYFINKLMKRGRVGEINSTTVYPSARMSRRVPFGTGAAMWQRQDSEQLSYAPAGYLKLRDFQGALLDRVLRNQPMAPEFSPFVKTSALNNWLRKMQSNVASEAAAETQLTRWFDGFRVMKFLNWLSESAHPKVPVRVAAREILAWRDESVDGDAMAILNALRAADRCA